MCISHLTCLAYINQKSRHASHSTYLTYEQQEENLQQSLCFDSLEERSTCRLIFETHYSSLCLLFLCGGKYVNFNGNQFCELLHCLLEKLALQCSHVSYTLYIFLN
ncbi:gastrin/cholecystokinin-like peptide [Platysternon megacephalum]|uniref:Gastrin/cholecystokinin-like peptide n=1 Tax=Platysternon megacephalum TaxID=55544 RepID=A0A4D9EQ28_9SAUR|nr:gastrin/cholecystokinin-like peptide [Platysternon megacephalum]